MMGVGEVIAWGCFVAFVLLTYTATVKDFSSSASEEEIRTDRKEKVKKKQLPKSSENGLRKRQNKLNVDSSKSKDEDNLAVEETSTKPSLYSQLRQKLSDDRLQECLSCFSIVGNVSTVFKLEPAEDSDLSYLYGLRAFLSLSITCLHYHLLAITDEEFLTFKVNRVTLSVFSLSWFFFISAMLNTCMTFKRMQKQLFSIPRYIMKRYFRLSPPLVAAVFYTLYLAPRSSTGNQKSHFREYCLERNVHLSWTLLSSFSEEKFLVSCLEFAWFVENDFFVMLGILPLLLLYTKYPTQCTLACMLLAGGWGVFVAHCTFHEVVMDRWKVPNFTASWALGVWMGYLLFNSTTSTSNNRNIEKENVAVRTAAPPRVHWLLDWLLWVCFYISSLGFPAVKVLLGDFTYFSIQWNWIVAQPLIAYVTWHMNQPGQWSLLKRFLSHPVWQPLGRISYSTYLFHMLFMKDFMVDPNLNSSINLVMGRQVLVVVAVQILCFIPAILVEEPSKKLQALLI